MWVFVVCTFIDNEYASLLFSQAKVLKESDAYKQLICIMQRVHFQIRKSEKSVFREAWGPELTSQSFPVPCFWSRGFVPHRKWNLMLLVHQNTGKSLWKKRFCCTLSTLGRFDRANKKNLSYTLKAAIRLSNTSSNQRLWECVRCRRNVYPYTLNDFPSWLSTSKNQPFFINNRGFTERYFSDKVHASLMIETALCDGASFRRLISLIELKNLHQFWDFVLNIVTLTCNV